MAQLPDGSMKELMDNQEILDAVIKGYPIFREQDMVEVHNKSLPGQPPMRFRIVSFDNMTMHLVGVPK